MLCAGSSSRPPGCRKIGPGGSSAGLVEGGLPLDAVGDDMEEPLAGWHVVGVAGLDGFPGVPGGVGCRKPEHPGEPGLAVGPVVGQGLAGPLAGNQDAPSGVAEVFAAVGFSFATAWPQVRAWVLGLDAVTEPVRAGRRARLISECVGEPSGVGGLGVGGGLVTVADVLGQVLGEVADAPAGVLGSSEHALGIEAVAEPGYVQRVGQTRRQS